MKMVKIVKTINPKEDSFDTFLVQRQIDAIEEDLKFLRWSIKIIFVMIVFVCIALAFVVLS